MLVKNKSQLISAGKQLQIVTELQKEKYCLACQAIGGGSSLYKKCQKLLRRPHCCQLTKSFALGTTSKCDVTEEELQFHRTYQPTETDSIDMTLMELRSVDIEGIGRTRPFFEQENVYKAS